MLRLHERLLVDVLDGFGGIDARAVLELDDLGDQLPFAVRDTGLEILLVRSGPAGGRGAGHEFSWSVVAVPCLGRSAISASVVSMSEATDAAFCSATRTTFVGSMTPASTRSWYWPDAAL